jgi:hypothetical protein
MTTAKISVLSIGALGICSILGNTNAPNPDVSPDFDGNRVEAKSTTS